MAAQALGAGGWSWFSEPRAVHYQGVHHRTYAGWVEPDGDEVVSSWDGQERVRAVIGHNREPDDHSSPVLHVQPDGRIVAFSSQHSGQRMRMQVSVRPEDVTSWGHREALEINTAGDRGFTYPNPIRLAGEGGRLYLFWRGGDWLPAYSSYSSETGWAPGRPLLGVRSRRPFRRPYVKYASDGQETIAFAFTDGHPRQLRTSVWFALYRRGAFYGADGRQIGTLGTPLPAVRTDRVYDGPRLRRRAWLHDLALAPGGRPVLVYATFGPAGRHRYEYATWDGRRWRRSKIVDAGAPIGSGERYYSGGIALDHGDPSIVYLSRQVRGIHEVERWQTRTRGRKWRRQSLTRGSLADNVRPVVPLGLHLGERQVLWMQGRYYNYRRFDTSILVPSPLSSGPTAEFDARVAKTGESWTATLDPSRTQAGPSGMANAEWDFGDGQSAPGAGPITHLYERPGRYFAKLVVTDAMGRRDVYVREIELR